jgi:hypothetical protein
LLRQTTGRKAWATERTRRRLFFRAQGAITRLRRNTGKIPWPYSNSDSDVYFPCEGPDVGIFLAQGKTTLHRRHKMERFHLPNKNWSNDVCGSMMKGPLTELKNFTRKP